MFVGLLICMVVAFLSGVWVGNNGSVDAQPQQAEVTETSQESPTGQLGELNFFAQQQDSPPAEPPLAQVAEAQRPDTTLREEVSRKVQVQSSPATPTNTKAETSVTDEGPMLIQVFSSKDQLQADRLVDKLVAGGFPAFAISEDVEGNTVYRVRIGPYRARERAEEVADLVKKSFKVDTWITRAGG